MKDSISVSELQGFEWDQANAEKKWQAHHVSPSEAEQVFFNKPLLKGDDTKHSQKEKRHYVLGQTDQGRPLFVTFTVRKSRIRVISARAMSRKERKIYKQL